MTTRLKTILSVLVLFAAALAAPSARSAVAVQVAGNTATADITLLGLGAEMILTFDDAQQLTPANLGIRADLVSILDPALQLRLPETLTSVATALPLLITVEPRSSSGFAMNNTVRVEVHTHLLPYTAGSPFRLFKAPLGGQFVDITDEVAPGSVRTRGTTGGFSQFLVLVDLRDTGQVIDLKLAALRSRAAALGAGDRATVEGFLDAAEAAVDEARFADAIAAIDALRAHVSANAGAGIPNTWTPLVRGDNLAGDLLAGAATLKFSVGFLRDYGH